MPQLNFNALATEGPQGIYQGFMQGQQLRNQLAGQEQQRQLADIQLQNAMREQRLAGEEEAAWKTGAGDPQKVLAELESRGLGKQALTLRKSLDERRAAQLTQAKTIAELAKQTATQAMANPQNAAQIYTNFGKRLGIDVTDDLAEIQKFGADTEAIKQWAAGHALEADKLLPKFQHFDTGGGVQTGTTDWAGKFTPSQTIQKTATPDALMADARARERLNAEMAVGQLTPESLDVAANVYLQTGQLPTGLGKAAAGLRSQVMNRATELSGGKPAADVAGDIVGAKLDVASRAKAIKDFSTGTQGRQVNAFNTAIDHLDTMDKLSDALQNSDVKAINAIGNTVARQTGAPAPTNFDAAKQIVTAEVIKAVVASGGGVTERQEAERNFAAASSPAQLKGVIDTYKKLLGGQLNSLGLQYANTTGRKDFETKLTPAAKTEFQRIRSEQQPAGAAPRALAPADQQALDWANANPKDPRAAQIKQRLGL